MIKSFSFNWYGLILAISALIAWFTARKRAKLYNILPEQVDDAIIFLVPVAIIGARLYHVIDNWNYYQQDLIQVLFIWQGGLGIFGAIIFGTVSLIIYANLKKIKILPACDLAAGSFVLASAIGRLANFANLEAFGPPTDLPWGIFIPIENRPQSYISSQYFHPTFFYDMFWNFFIFFAILLFSKRLAKYPGATFSAYAMLYSIGRFFIEFFRFDTWMIGQVKMAQVLSVLIFIIASIILSKIIFKIRVR